MKIPKAIPFLAVALTSIFSASADELVFQKTNYDQHKKEQSIYEPKDKLDEYIIKGITYSTKFIPLIMDSSNLSFGSYMLCSSLNWSYLILLNFNSSAGSDKVELIVIAKNEILLGIFTYEKYFNKKYHIFSLKI